jgi:hypothetical protein
VAPVHHAITVTRDARPAHHSEASAHPAVTVHHAGIAHHAKTIAREAFAAGVCTEAIANHRLTRHAGDIPVAAFNRFPIFANESAALLPASHHPVNLTIGGIGLAQE